jgi:hypothetical protein
MSLVAFKVATQGCLKTIGHQKGPAVRIIRISSVSLRFRIRTVRVLLFQNLEVGVGFFLSFMGVMH